MNNKLQLDDLTIDFSKQTVKRNQEVIVLPKLSYNLFVYLINNHQKTCSISSLIEGVWTHTNVSDETVIQRIRLLRKALNDNPKTPRYIESVRGFGYRLIPQPLEFEPKNKLRSDISYKTINPFNTNWLVKFGIATPMIIVLIYFAAISLTDNNDNFSTQQLPPSKLNQPDTLIERAHYYRKIGQQDDLQRAVEIYQKLLQKNNNNHPAAIGLSFSLSGLVCRYNQPVKFAKEAQKLIENRLTKISSQADALEALAFSFDCQGNLLKALSYYQKAIALNPDAFSAISSAAHLLEKRGHLIKALHWNLKVKKSLNNPPITDLQIARNLELLGFHSRAEQIYQYLFEYYPDNVFINESYPQFLFNQQRFAESDKIIQQTLKRQINRRAVYQLGGELAWLIKDIDVATNWFEKAMRVNSNSSFSTTTFQILKNNLTKEQALNKVNQLNQYIHNGDTWPETYLEIILLQLHVLDQKSNAISTLSKLFKSGFMDKNYLQISPWFSNIKKNQRFQLLLEKLNQKQEQMRQQVLEADWLPDELLNEKKPWGELSI